MGDCRDEAAMLLWMHLIHTHQIEITEARLHGVPSHTVVPAATQRRAALAIAELWYDRSDAEKTKYMYRYRQYSQKYHSKTDVSTEDAVQFKTLRQILESDCRVKKITLEP